MSVKYIAPLFAVAFLLGSWIAVSSVKGEVASNNIQGYHCTPITKHIGIESAKKHVEAYQAAVRG